MRLPGFEFGIRHSGSNHRAPLIERFPDPRRTIDGWIETSEEARKGGFKLFALHSMRGLGGVGPARVARQEG